MINHSEILLPCTNGKLNVEGEPVKGIGFYSKETNKRLQTIYISTTNLTGRIYLYGTLSLEPTVNDWSLIKLEDKDYLEYYNLNNYMYSKIDNRMFNIKGSYTYFKAKLDRSYIEEFKNLPTKYIPDNVISWQDVQMDMSSAISSKAKDIPSENRIIRNLEKYGNIDKIMICY